MFACSTRDEIQRRLSLLLGQARFFNNYPPLNNILWPLGSGNAMNMRAVLVFGTLQTAFVCVWRGGLASVRCPDTIAAKSERSVAALQKLFLSPT